MEDLILHVTVVEELETCWTALKPVNQVLVSQHDTVYTLWAYLNNVVQDQVTRLKNRASDLKKNKLPKNMTEHCVSKFKQMVLVSDKWLEENEKKKSNVYKILVNTILKVRQT